MTRATILKDNIDNNIWLKLLLAMIYIKNSCPTKAFENLSAHQAHFHKQLNLKHLWIIGSMVYVLLYKEKRLIKSEMWVSQALIGILVGYDGHTIYRVHIKEQKKVIRVIKLHIFEDYEAKKSTNLPDYFDNLSTFQGFHYNNDDYEELKDQISRTSQKVNPREEEPETRTQKCQKVSTLSISTRVNDAETEPKG